jgi:mono/diheme cytochrome c family protein
MWFPETQWRHKLSRIPAVAAGVLREVCIGETMTHLKTLLAASTFAAVFAVTGQGQSGLIGRGKELTEQVAKCQDCHTPRTATGELDKNAWLQGVAADPVKEPGKPVVHIPDITGRGNLWMLWGEKGMLAFLEKGTSPSGAKPSTHMPAYKLKQDDAEAIVAYLKSLH